MPRRARSQAYPSKPVHIVVGFAPGGVTDIIARLIGEWLSQRLGQQFIVENRPGAASNIATETVIRSAPDGYTLLLVGPAAAINATLYPNLSFSFVRDTAPIASLYNAPLIMEVNPSLPFETVPEFIAYAKANPGKINFASSGSGTSSHVTGELFKRAAGIEMQHVPYRGAAPALTDLLGGQVQAMFDNVLSSIENVRAGKLRALAVTTATRWDGLPDIPTVAESVPGFEASGWQGLVAPKNVPAEIIERLNTEINLGLADPVVSTRIAELGSTVFASSPAAFARFIDAETRKWGKVIRAAGLKAE
ncbi:MAG: Bug family tripartite tricarboxylate transporter substrate binding protein [Xanthobacteraceae bacterium]